MNQRKVLILLRLESQDVDKYNKIFTYKASYLREKRKEIEQKFKSERIFNIINYICIRTWNRYWGNKIL
ncbi:hypothetical protein [Candidatus Nanopusillus massiliensis]|uniref:hypothetical protein n=1 Tax=Candidatus Nanopusillus massiliensis TaxID=2897163 RepID=UPI001E296BC0|nr:hypothetical protein [Candidatus Nanopusillus massiliensis]